MLKYDLGNLPESMVKSSEPIHRIAEWAPMASHCSTAPAVFILSEPERIERRAEVREKLYNDFNMENVFFVLSNHRQENQLLETQLEMEARVYGDIIVGDFSNEKHESGTKKIVLALNQFIKNCVSQIVTVMDDSIDFMTIH